METKQNMKRLFIFLTVVVTTTMSFAQISDRENDESTYLLGARPEQGNIGFFMAMSTADISDLADTDWNESGIPIINVKYYWTDQFVLKAGVQIWKKRRVLDGTLDNSGFYNLTSYTHEEVDANWDLNIGIPAILSNNSFSKSNFKKNKEVLVFKNDKELIKNIFYLIENKKAANQLAINSQKTIKKKYNRNKVLLKYAEII